MACSPRISDAYLEPVLEAMLRQFPFRIRGFNTDNGSEFINATVVKGAFPSSPDLRSLRVHSLIGKDWGQAVLSTLQ